MKMLFPALLAAASALAITPAAMATTIQLQLSSGATTVDSTASTTGTTTYIGTVGSGWVVDVTTGLGPPLETGNPELDISSVNVAGSAGAGPLTILLTATGLTSPLGPLGGVLNINGNSNYAGTAITTQAFLSTTDAAFCDVVSSTCLALTGVGSASGVSYAGTASGSAATGAGPYSLTELVTINPNSDPGFQTSFDDSLTITPEPSSLLLLGTGLLGLAFVAFRKAKTSDAVLSL